MGVTQYTFSAEQREMSSAATVTMNDVDGAIMCITVEKKRYLLPCECLPLFSERMYMVAYFLHARIRLQKYSVVNTRHQRTQHSSVSKLIRVKTRFLRIRVNLRVK